MVYFKLYFGFMAFLLIGVFLWLAFLTVDCYSTTDLNRKDCKMTQRPNVWAERYE